MAEETAEMQGKRVLSDAKLIEDGAKYIPTDGGLRLEVTANQVAQAKQEMNEAHRITDKIDDVKKIDFLVGIMRHWTLTAHMPEVFEKGGNLASCLGQKLQKEEKMEVHFTQGSYAELEEIAKDKEFNEKYLRLESILKGIDFENSEANDSKSQESGQVPQ